MGPSPVPDDTPEDRHRFLFDALGRGVVFADAAGLVVDANRSAEAMAGAAPGALTGRPLFGPEWATIGADGSQIPPEELPAARALLTRGTVPSTLVGIVPRTGGERRWLEVSSHPRLRPGESLPFGTCTLLEDVTERRREESSRRGGHSRLELALDIAGAGWWEQDFVSGEVLWSDRMWELSGHEPGSVPASYQAWRSRIHPDDVERVEAAVLGGWKGRTEMSVEYRFRGADGSERWQRSLARPVPCPDGGEPRYLGISIDVTESRRAQDDLRRSEAWSRLLFDLAPEPFFVGEADGRFVDVNRKACEVLGYSREELLGMNVLQIDADVDRRAFEAKTVSLGASGTAVFPTRLRRRDGSLVPVELHVGTLQAEEESLRYFALARDMTEREKAKRALEERERELLAAQRTGKVGTWYRSLVGGGSWWSEETYRIHGLEPEGEVPTVEAALRHYDSMSADRLRTAVEALRRDGTPYEVEVVVVRPDRARMTMIARGEAVRDQEGTITATRGTVVDVTAYARLQAEVEEARRRLAHAARVSLLGELVASLAHELGQPLMVVLGGADLAAEALAKRRPDLRAAREFVGDVVAAGRRAKTVLEGLRGRLVGTEPGTELLDLNAVVRSAVRLFSVEARRRSTAVELELEEGVLLVEGIRTRLDQVVLDLVLNALDALSGREAPRLVRVATRRETGQALLAVGDSGPGVPRELAETIFEPFFTTRPGALGLGLSISRSIVEDHGGSIEVRKGERGGALFEVRLPCVPAAVGSETGG